jgi:hypothetical protein
MLSQLLLDDGIVAASFRRQARFDELSLRDVLG